MSMDEFAGVLDRLRCLDCYDLPFLSKLDRGDWFYNGAVDFFLRKATPAKRKKIWEVISEPELKVPCGG